MQSFVYREKSSEEKTSLGDTSVECAGALCEFLQLHLPLVIL